MKKHLTAIILLAAAACLLLGLEAMLLTLRMRTGVESLAGAMSKGSPRSLDDFASALIGCEPSSEQARLGREALYEMGYSSLPVDHFTGRLFSDAVVCAVLGGALILACGSVVFVIAERRKRIRYEEGLIRRVNSALRGEEEFHPETGEERLLKKLFDEVKRVNAVREDSAAEIREYVENVAHEIKSPTSGILLNLDLIERGGVTEGKLSAARKCAKRIESCVSGLLTLARLRAGKVRMTFEMTELGEIARETAEELEANGIETLITGESAEVNCDRTRIKEALRNLIINASKHQQQGLPVEVELSSGGDFASVCVKDNGPGITDGALIERYSVGEEDGTSSGIGLSLAREVAKRHSGRLIIKKPEKGSSIELMLPILKLKKGI